MTDALGFNNNYMFNMPSLTQFQSGMGIAAPDSKGLFSSFAMDNSMMPPMDSFFKQMQQSQAQMQALFIQVLTQILNNPNINHKPPKEIDDNFRPYDYNKYGDNGAKISKLDPKMQEKTMQLMDYAASLGMKVMITSGYRTPEEQKALCKKTSLAVANSPHPQGKAVDIKIEGGEDEDYKKLGDFAKSIGMRWGGDFKHPEPERWHFDYGWR